MQRVLVILVVALLVTASLGAGALAAHWPFWRRAWQWHQADGAVASIEGGPRVVMRGGALTALPVDSGDDVLAQFAAGAPGTTMLLRLHAGRIAAWSAPRVNAQAMLDGRGLTSLVLQPLFTALAAQHPGLLDRPIGAVLEAWRQDARGATTPRQLLALVGGGVDQAPAIKPLNPFRATARLASGPDFQAAARALFDPGQPAQLHLHQAAAAQILAEVAALLEQRPFAEVLERQIWSHHAAGDASLLLDRRRGNPALHCCMLAAPADWLRVAILPGPASADGPGLPRRVTTSGRTLVAGNDAAVLWIGTGAPPSGLETLLPAGASAAGG